MLTPHVKCKLGDWGKSGMIVLLLLGCHFPYLWKNLRQPSESLKLNPMFLFLKSEFGSGKKARGKYVDFHAVFCGQFSISLHSSVQNWSLLL